MFEPAAAARVRLLGLDVDGVLTDNAIFVGDLDGHRVEFKRFDIQDGLGLVLLRFAAFKAVLVTARPSAATAHRAAELRIECVQVRGAHKVEALQEILDREGIEWSEVAFVGDDLADLPVLRRVGLPVTVANATPDVRAAAQAVTTAPGGHGAVREVIEGLLRARGEWDAVVERYLAEAAAGVR